MGVQSSENGEGDAWKSRAHLLRTASLSGSRPQSHGLMVPSGCERTLVGIDTDRGVEPALAR
jgi:hypothetical protein